MVNHPHQVRDADALSTRLVDVQPIQPNALIWQAFNDPDCTDEDFQALVRSIHGETGEEL